jgi:hypothetical protein
MVFLGRIIMNGMADIAEETGLPSIHYFNGTFAYLVTPAACRTLIKHLLPLVSGPAEAVSSVNETGNAPRHRAVNGPSCERSIRSR